MLKNCLENTSRISAERYSFLYPPFLGVGGMLTSLGTYALTGNKDLGLGVAVVFSALLVCSVTAAHMANEYQGRTELHRALLENNEASAYDTFLEIANGEADLSKLDKKDWNGESAKDVMKSSNNINPNIKKHYCQIETLFHHKSKEHVEIPSLVELASATCARHVRP